MVSPDLNQEYYGDKLANPEQAATNKIINGFIDDIFIGDKTKIDNSSLTNYVDTRRGTDGHMDWSRGSTFPATALPHGFNFYTPIQHAKQLGEGADWLYDYKKFNNSDNLPTLNGFGVSHEPAPWMHDYDQFCVMPQIGSIVNVKADERSLAYSHDNEVAQPDYYSVKFNNGIIGEIAPNDHSAIFKFTFPKDVSTGRIIFDSLLDTQDPSRDANSNDSFVFNDTAGGYAANVFHG
jgi:putative alpha-1,2-mannosidase